MLFIVDLRPPVPIVCLNARAFFPLVMLYIVTVGIILVIAGMVLRDGCYSANKCQRQSENEARLESHIFFFSKNGFGSSTFSGPLENKTLHA